jgi:hypothetical protein
MSCSVAFAEISDKEKRTRMKLNFFIDTHLFRAIHGGWPYLLTEKQVLFFG